MTSPARPASGTARAAIRNLRNGTASPETSDDTETSFIRSLFITETLAKNEQTCRARVSEAQFMSRLEITSALAANLTRCAVKSEADRAALQKLFLETSRAKAK